MSVGFWVRGQAASVRWSYFAGQSLCGILGRMMWGHRSSRRVCWWLSVLPRIFTLAIQALPAFSRLHQRQAVSLHLHSSDFSLQKIDA